MSGAKSLTAEPVTVTVDELESAADVLARYCKIIQAQRDGQWYSLMAARSIIGEAAILAKYGSQDD